MKSTLLYLSNLTRDLILGKYTRGDRRSTCNNNERLGNVRYG